MSQTIGTSCEGPRAEIVVTINALPLAPAVTTPVTFCQGATAAPLTATGAGLLWYTTATGGTGSITAPTPSTAASGNTSYWVSQTIGCESPRIQIVVTVNALPIAPAVTTPVAYCQGATAAPLTATGTGLLWYTTATGGTGSTTAPTPSTATTGNTSYWVSQTIGCESPRAEIVVTVNALPPAPAVTPVTYCQNETAASLTATGSGLLWYTTATGGTGSVIAPTPSTTTAGNTSYWVSQTNGSSCEGPRAEIVVTVNALPNVNAGLDATIPGGTSTSLNATVTGTGPFTYSWTPAAQLVNASIEDPTTVNLLTTTVFTLTATSTASSCANSDQVTITVSGGALTSNPTATPGTICAGENVQLDAIASGGSGTYTYTWTSIPAGFTSSVANPTANPAVNTTYLVEVSDGSATVNSQVTVTVNALPIAPAVTSPVTYCQNETAAPLTATGTGLLWYTTATGGTGSTTAPTPSTATSGNTSYWVSQTNGSCEGPRAEIVVTVNALPIVNAGIDATIPGGTSTSLNATVTGTGPFTYSWTPAAQLVNASIEDPTTVNLATTTTFTLIATSTASSCSNTDQVTITVSGGGLTSIPTATPGTICAGENVQLDAVAGGGSGTYTYTWTSLPAGFTSTAANPTANPAVNTTYLVAVNDGFSTVNSQVTVTVNSLPIAPAVTTPVTYCQNETAASLTAAGTGLLWYTTATGGTGSVIAPTPSTATPGSTSYWVSQTNGSSCEGPRALIVVTVNALPIVNAGIDATIPGGTSISLNSTVTGTGPFTYSWTPAAQLVNSSIEDPTTVNLATTTVFTLTATSTASSCFNTDAVTITVSGGALTSNPTATPGTICAGETVQLDAVAGGGSGTYTYAWTSLPAGFSSSAANPTVNPAVNTTYFVEVSDGSATVNSQVTVTVNAIPLAPAVTTPVTYCQGTTAAPLIATGTGLLWYTTATGGTGSVTAPSPSTSVSGNTSYWVSQTNGSSCEGPRAEM